MKKGFIALLSVCSVPFAANAANEGVPTYYQTQNAPTANQLSYDQYQSQGYSKYVGKSGSKQVVGSRTYSYQTPRQTVPDTSSMNTGMTANGIALPIEADKHTSVYGEYSRRFADFQFKTGVNSVLEWDDMIFNELTVGARHNFSIRNFDMFAYGEYTYGNMESGGLSMDYDLEPYVASNPTDGIFTISIGDQSGHTNHFRIGVGAYHIWDISGWKFSPIIGYEIFKHNLEMSDHYYPNPGVYLPLMTNTGAYVYGETTDTIGQVIYHSVPIDGAVPDNWYQVCMSPEDIKVALTTGAADAYGYGYIQTQTSVTGETEIITENYTNLNLGTIPWGVGENECVVIGGDGPIIVEGTTHIYNTTWSGFYIGLEIEKQMTWSDKLRLYAQFSLPKYSSEGIWPNRDDWQQNPSFLDEGSSGSYAYAFELEYNMRLSDRLALSLRADTNCFHVGKIPGKLYIAEYTDFVAVKDANGDYTGEYYLETTAAHTEDVSESLKEATWQSFGLHLGFKYAF
ncbi:MAG: hypothetical protein IJ560_00575 [Alphaproteobacteria bacterium]|nr:hypothetical protein [Alphaproteobacteria bacterium]